MRSGTAPKTLAFYLHTDVETRTRALDAGMDLVVPRSRMAREGAALVDGLLAGAPACRANPLHRCRTSADVLRALRPE
jgi:hypothetical protein